MVARPGRLQSAFTAGEIAPSLHDRTELKYYSTGARLMRNVEIIPQGGFRVRPGTIDLGAVPADARRLLPFTASNGEAYDLVFSPGQFQAWGSASLLQTVSAAALTSGILPEMTEAQVLDTMLLFEPNLKPQRIIHRGPTNWEIGDMPINAPFNWDYGGPIGGGSYTNGVPAQWELKFEGLKNATVDQAATALTVTVNAAASSAITYDGNLATLASDLQGLIDGLATAANVAVSVKAGATDTLVAEFDLEGGATAPASLSIAITVGTASASVTKIDEWISGTQKAKFEIAFTGLQVLLTSGGSVFNLTVSRQDTESIAYVSNLASLATSVRAAILNLPNVFPGVTVTVENSRLVITFAGAGNEGDGWAVSGTVVNKADAAILAYKKTKGVAPGEPVISADRGWPGCGCFHQQRLAIGGFRSLPNAYGFSLAGNAFEFDIRYSGANGPMLVPLDAAGGERIVRIVAGRNLQIFSTLGEYWLAERAINAQEAPNWVQASTNGSRPGARVVPVSGASVYPHKSGGVISEFRYTDLEGNFVSQDISLLAPHLVGDVAAMALQRSSVDQRTDLLTLINADGTARQIGMMRDQEVTAFSRFETGGTPIDVSVNGRNELRWIMQRPNGRRLEQSSSERLLDQSIAFDHGNAPTATITGLDALEGLTVWAIADNEVFGPYVVSSGQIVLPVPVVSGHAGTWTPPMVTTLPPPRDIGPGTVLRRKARIHSAWISVENTTSLAISANGGAVFDVDLRRQGSQADLPELAEGFTGMIPIRGLRGFADEPTITITQLRPGRLTVRSLTIEAAL